MNELQKNEITQPNKVSNSIEETHPVKVPTNSTVKVKTGSVESLQDPALQQDAVEATAPVAVANGGGGGDIGDTAPVKVAAGKPRRWPWIAGGIALILVLGAIGGYIGYRMAMQQRAQQSSQQIAMTATEQFMLGLQEQQNGQLENALKRFKYVIQLNPGFPGAAQKLTEVMMAMAASKTPTVVVVEATMTMTPTPDFRGEEEIFNNAHQLMVDKKYIDALNVMDTLRNKNITYRAIDVDGMYYEALRFRGMSRLNTGMLESGLYDLAVASRFAPLDVDALGAQTWARLYLTGSASWGVNWDRVVTIFAQIAPYYPNLRDINGVTAVERYRLALIHWGDQLFAAGKYCDAVGKYNDAQNVANNAALAPTVTEADNKCKGPSATPAPATATATMTITLTHTPGPTVAGVTETPVPAATTAVPPAETTAPTAAATAAPTAAPTAAATAAPTAAATAIPPTDTPAPTKASVPTPTST